jgi:substrate import-associated zinc metallohydrolase lipoprotein
MTMKKIFFYITLVTLLTACTKDELDPDSVLLGMGGDQWERTELDDWLYHEFVVPYNMEIKYKWDPYELDLSKNYVPVKEEKVRELMTAVKKVWIESYAKAAGSPNIIKSLSPKRYVLIGSLEYDSNGTATLGNAEGENKIRLFDVNAFDITDEAMVRRVMGTVEHEFVHTLTAVVKYPEEWQTICKDDYDGNYRTMTDDPAVYAPLGFVTRYAHSNPDEDIAETVKLIVLNGQAWFNDYVAFAGVVGGPRLRAKEAILVNYYKSNYNIDFYESAPGKKDGLVYITQEVIAKLHE